MKALREKAAQGGVKVSVSVTMLVGFEFFLTGCFAALQGLTAKNELEQMEKEDLTGMNRLELTLQAAKRKASKQV